MAAFELSQHALDGPGAAGAGAIARRFADEVLERINQLAAGAPDALHRLRVSIRRLRTWLRACKAVLDGAITRRDRRRLRRFARSTESAREREVALEWLDAHQWTTPVHAGAAYLRERIEQNRDDRAEHDALRPKHLHAVEDVATALASFTPADSDRPTLAEVLALTIRAALQALHDAVEIMQGDPSPRNAHRVRIAAKRIKYLLEPLDHVVGVREALERLGRAQDQLGTMRDTHQIAKRIVNEVARIARREAKDRARKTLGWEHRASGATGEQLSQSLLELAVHAEHESREAADVVSHEWLANEGAALEQPVAGVIAHLESVVPVVTAQQPRE